MCSCAATLDEFSYSARTAAQQVESVRRLRGSFRYLAMSPSVDATIVGIRTALFASGQGRSAGVIDVQIAATAVVHGASVLHYDSDFDHIAAAYTGLTARWIVPRSSVD